MAISETFERSADVRSFHILYSSTIDRYTAFRPSTKLPAHSKNKKRVAEKPLLQQVLSQAGIKAQRDETPQRKARRSVPPKEFDMKSSFDLGNPIKRRALRATDSNKQKKPSPLAKCIDDN